MISTPSAHGGSFVNRRLAALSVLAVSAALASPALPGVDASSAVPHGQKRVCARPAVGFAACDAHVVTNAKTAKPLASTTWTSGFGADTLQKVYQPGGSAVTVAVVDAYKSPNAGPDLAEYRRVM